jgi:hypothetical protein
MVYRSAKEHQQDVDKNQEAVKGIERTGIGTLPDDGIDVHEPNPNEASQ